MQQTLTSVGRTFRFALKSRKWVSLLRPGILTGALILLGLGISPVQAQDLQRIKPRSLYSDLRAITTGDVVTILLMEWTSGSNESSTNTDFEHLLEAKNSATGAFSFLPGLGLETGVSSDQTAKGSTSRQGTLRGKMTAVVMEVMPNGLLRLEGQRSVNVNGEDQITILTGLVRPQDIRSDNTVYSYLIADAAITYQGSGMVNDVSKPGILTRFINWLF